MRSGGAPRCSPDVVTWLLRGTIGQQRTTLEVHAQWVLDQGCVQIHDVSRAQDEWSRAIDNPSQGARPPFAA